MGLKNDLAQLVNSGFTVCYRRPELYPTATPTVYTLFQILGGPVHIKFIIARLMGPGADASGAQFTVDICGVANLGGTIVANINGPVNSLVMVPCNGAAVTAGGVLTHPWLDTAVASDGCFASIGLVQLTITTAVPANPVEWMMAYRKLNPLANVIAP